MWCLEWVWLGGEGVEEGVLVVVYREVDGLERWQREDIWLFLLE